MMAMRAEYLRIEGTVMRSLLVALSLFGFVAHAGAQDFDMPTLRGSSPFIPAKPQYTRWAGLYVGGQVGQSSSEMNFAGATESLVEHILRSTALLNEFRPSEWDVLGKENPSGTSYGLFVGYNAQFDNVIVGLEFHYNRSSFFANAPVTPIGRSVTVASGLIYNVNIDGSASMRITDYGSLRARGGWVAGNFLPYATFGLAMGRADIARTARVSGTETTPCDPQPCVPVVVPFNWSASDAKNAHFIYGWSAGAGVDWLVMPNVFLRGEVEYMGFTAAQGVKAEIGTARVGAGLKF